MTDNERMERVKSMIENFPLKETIDVCDFNPYIAGIGYDELRYIFINPCGEPAFESNNVPNSESDDDDDYKVFSWDELSDFEKSEVEKFLCDITKHINEEGYIFGLPRKQILQNHTHVVYKTSNGINLFYTCCNSSRTAATIVRHIDDTDYIYIPDIKQQIV